MPKMSVRGRAARALVAVSAALTAAALALPATAAQALLRPDSTETRDRPATELGVDISWPQCGDEIPLQPAFVIVGVTGGKASTTNPCLEEQLEWAAEATGATDQPPLQLYVNTAHPGSLGEWWPESDELPDGAAIDNPYGTCAGSHTSRACAYVYGQVRAWQAAHVRGIEEPVEYRWWLDVEVINSWSTNRLLNRASLEGMADHLLGLGAEVGVYSMHSMWQEIVGRVPPTSSLHGLPTWLPGADSASEARELCESESFLPDSEVVLTQFVSRGLDFNVSCTG